MISRGSSFSGRERHCLFLNTNGPRFADISAAAELDLLDDGRAVAMADWDQDGDLDLLLANRTAPRLRLLRNDLPRENHFLALRLEGRDCNRDAIGARVELHTAGSQPRRLIETVRAGDGFLTQSSKWLHFGLGKSENIQRLLVRWPGSTAWEEFHGLQADQRYQLTQGSGEPELVEKTALAELVAEPPSLPKSSDKARVVLTRRRTFPQLEFLSFEGESSSLLSGQSKPVLVNLWASWCLPCLEELREYSNRRDELEQAGLHVAALCTDELDTSTGGDLEAAQEFLSKIDFPFTSGRATTQAVSRITALHHQIFYKERPLPLPCSFLLDGQGRLAVIYRGKVTVDQLLQDLPLLNASPETLDEQAFPVPGHFVFRGPGINPLSLVRAYRDGGYLEDARQELQEVLANVPEGSAEKVEGSAGPSGKFFADVYRELATLEAELGNGNASLAAWRQAARSDPGNPALAVSLALADARQGQQDEATRQLEALTQQFPEQPGIWRMVGAAWLQMQDVSRAVEHFARAVELAPEDVAARFDLASGLQLQGDAQPAIAEYETILQSHPSHAQALNNLAWLLATHPVAQFRDGMRGVELAQRACQATQEQIPVFLGTLGAAHAEAGNFPDAVRVTAQALRLARGMGEDNLASQLADRLKLHQQGLPYHQPPR